MHDYVAVNSYAEQKNRERTEFLITSKENNSFCPLTMELRVDEIHNFLSATEKISGGRFQPKFPFCLVGLHTCGDLGSTALRLYAEIPTARALCIVGCCYHHITESHDNGNSKLFVTAGIVILMEHDYIITFPNRTYS